MDGYVNNTTLTGAKTLLIKVHSSNRCSVGKLPDLGIPGTYKHGNDSPPRNAREEVETLVHSNSQNDAQIRWNEQLPDYYICRLHPSLTWPILF